MARFPSLLAILACGLAIVQTVPEAAAQIAKPPGISSAENSDLTPERLARFSGANSPDRPRCHARVRGQDRFRRMCRAGPRSGAPLIVFSDSHGTELSFALRQRARAENLRVTQVTGSACPPALGFSPEMRPLCADFTRDMLDAIERQGPATILMAANYELWHKEASQAAFWQGFEETIAALKAAGHRVIVLGPIPTATGGPLPEVLSRLVQSGNEPRAYRFDVSAAMHSDILPRIEAMIARQAVEYLPVMGVLCGAERARTCRGLTGTTVHYFDTHHPSVPMANQLLDDLILPALRAKER